VSVLERSIVQVTEISRHAVHGEIILDLVSRKLVVSLSSTLHLCLVVMLGGFVAVLFLVETVLLSTEHLMVVLGRSGYMGFGVFSRCVLVRKWCVDWLDLMECLKMRSLMKRCLAVRCLAVRCLDVSAFRFDAAELVVFGVGMSLVRSLFRPVRGVRVTSVARHFVVLAGEFFVLHTRAVLHAIARAVFHSVLRHRVVLLLVRVFRAVLREKDTVMFVFLARFFTLSRGVIGGRLGAHGLDFDWDKVLARVKLLTHIRFQLKHQVARIDVGLGGAEGGRVGIEGCVVTLVPSVHIESVEIVPPVEVESLGVVVVGERLHVVVHHVPWHIGCVEAFAPGVKSRGPEIHHDGLALVQVFN
jgi:hypothetical protein